VFNDYFDPKKILNKVKLKLILSLVMGVSGTLLVMFGLAELVRGSQVSLCDCSEGSNIDQFSANQIAFINVDISGAVDKPGIYQLELGQRISHALEKAGGFTKQADSLFVSQSLNLAQKLKDGEKIYIPSLEESKQRSSELEFAKDGARSNDELTTKLGSKISINKAGLEELVELPGIGEKRATEIIENRPYSIVDELLVKEVIPQSVFEEIKDSLII